MTVEGLWTIIREVGGQSSNNNLSDLRGKTIGVCGHFLAHRLLSNKEVASTYHQLPLIDFHYSFERNLEGMLLLFQELDITLLIVFDGMENPLKSGTDEGRQDGRDNAVQKMKEFMNRVTKPTDEQRKEVATMSKLGVKVDDRAIVQIKTWAAKHKKSVRVLSAFLEADQQLVRMQLDGHIDAIWSEDGDFFCYGSSVMITKLWTYGENKGKCQIHYFSDVIAMDYFKDWCLTLEDFQLWCALSGNDLINKPLRLNLKAKVKELIQAKGSGDFDAILDDIEKKGKYNSTDALGVTTQVPAKGYAEQFKTVIRFFRWAPVFFIPGSEGKKLLSYEFQFCRIIPLHPPTSTEIMTAAYARETIMTATYAKNGPLVKRSFEPDKEYFTSAFGVNFTNITQSSFRDYFECIVWVRKPTLVLKPLVQPLYQPLDGSTPYSVPFSSEIDFKHTPIAYVLTDSLLTWLLVRGLRISKTNNRDAIELVVLQQSKVPNHVLLPVHTFRQNGGYLAISTIDMDKDAVWLQGDDLIKLIETLTDVTSNTLTKVLGIRNGVRDRSMALLRGGHIMVPSMKGTIAKSSAASIGQIFLIEFRVAPSQSTDPIYFVHLAFSMPTMTFMPFPYSKCTCVAGCNFCGHMIATFNLLHLVRDFPKLCKCCGKAGEESFDLLVRAMPMFVNTRTEPVSLNYMMEKLRIQAHEDINLYWELQSDEDEDEEKEVEVVVDDDDEENVTPARDIFFDAAYWMINNLACLGEPTKLNASVDEIKESNDKLKAQGKSEIDIKRQLPRLQRFEIIKNYMPETTLGGFTTFNKGHHIAELKRLDLQVCKESDIPKYIVDVIEIEKELGLQKIEEKKASMEAAAKAIRQDKRKEKRQGAEVREEMNEEERQGAEKREEMNTKNNDCTIN